MPKKLTVMISDELDAKLRETVFRTKGMKKGNLSDTIEEAIGIWIEQQTKEKKKK
jgi:hypothetical protein